MKQRFTRKNARNAESHGRWVSGIGRLPIRASSRTASVALAAPIRVNLRQILTLPTPQGGGCSVLPRSYRRESPKGLPGPLNVACCVLVSIEYETTGRADMSTHRQALGHVLSTSTTVLRGIGRWYRYHSTPSVCCFGFEDGTELRPACIADALGEVVVPDHIFDLQFFEVDGVVVPEQLQRRLVVEIEPLTQDVMMSSLEMTHRLASALAPLLTTRDDALRLLQLLLTSTMQ